MSSAEEARQEEMLSHSEKLKIMNAVQTWWKICTSLSQVVLPHHFYEAMHALFFKNYNECPQKIKKS